jgi:hypothetical protein
MHQVVVVFDGREFIQPNIALIEKWMPCDTLWAQTSLYGDYVMKQGGNFEY